MSSEVALVLSLISLAGVGILYFRMIRTERRVDEKLSDLESTIQNLTQ